MENKFTPGPWREYEYNGEAGLSFGDKIIRDQDKEEIAVIRFNAADWQSNASLIADAPELLSALKELLAEAESLREYVNTYREHDGWDGFDEDSSVKQARAIIEKATK